MGWHTFRHTVGSMLAEMGEHQLTIRDYLRHSNLHVTNKYLQATTEEQAPGAREIGGCDPAGRFAVGEQVKPDPVGAEERVPELFEGMSGGGALERLLDPNGPRLFSGVL